MKRTPKLIAILAALAALATPGCKESPTAPKSSDPPTPTVMTPVSAVITSITVTKFPAKKTDGSDWDLSVIVADRRPDLYVILKADNLSADFISDTFSNAIPGDTYIFQYPKDSSSGNLPVTLPYDSSRRVYVMDEDFGSGDDRLGWITVNLPAAYQGNNAHALSYTYTDSGGRLSVWVRGTWNY